MVNMPNGLDIDEGLLLAPCCHLTHWNHHPKAAIQIPSLVCHDELSEGVFLRRAPVRQFHVHDDLVVGRKDQTIFVFFDCHPFDQGSHRRLISSNFQRVECFQFVNPGEVAGIACRQLISPFKAGGSDKGVAEREFALLA